MSQTVVALPRLIELRSQYYPRLLQCVKEDGKGNRKGNGKGKEDFVQFSGDHVGRADAKFEVHRSETEDGLVHIRSCYNNKYLVLDKNNMWIAAKAEKPEEDQSKRSCTLLRPTSVDGDPKIIRLTHVHLGKNLGVSVEQSAHRGLLIIALAHYSYAIDVFKVIDWESLVLLPKYVAFKGDNDKFLRAHGQGGHNYLQFWDSNMEDYPMSVGNEIVQTTNGNNMISIRNLHYDRYWRLSPGWIWADSTTYGSDDTLFELIKFNNKIALRNVANKLFCKRLTVDGKEDCLNACSGAIDRWAELTVSELVISRKLENIHFRPWDARIYDESVVTMYNVPHTNATSTTDELTLDLSFTTKTSSTWNCNVSVKASFEATFEEGIPFIEEGKIKLGFEADAGYTWGETKEVEKRVATFLKVSVLPNTELTARITATSGMCDVPFSYTQRDVLYTGETVVTDMDDGVYTGINDFHFYIETKEEPLTKDPKIPAAEFKKVAKVSPSGEIIPI